MELSHPLRADAVPAVVTVDGTAPFGRAFLSRLDQAIDRYRPAPVR